MKKSKEMNKLVWKYFWQQKIKEVSIGLLVILGIIFLPILVYHLSNVILPELTQETFNFLDTGMTDLTNKFSLGALYWTIGILHLLVVAAGLATLFVLYLILVSWISSNWDKAVERAYEEIEGSRRNDKKKR